MKVVAVAGGHAARHDQLSAAGREVVEAADFEDDIDALLGSGLDERAGVDHHGIGYGQRFGERPLKGGLVVVDDGEDEASSTTRKPAA